MFIDFNCFFRDFSWPSPQSCSPNIFSVECHFQCTCSTDCLGREMCILHRNLLESFFQTICFYKFMHSGLSIHYLQIVIEQLHRIDRQNKLIPHMVTLHFTQVPFEVYVNTALIKREFTSKKQNLALGGPSTSGGPEPLPLVPLWLNSN